MHSLKKLMILSAILISSVVYGGEKVSKSLPLNDASNVIIENQRGNVHIIGNAENVVSVDGELDDKAEAFIFEQTGATIKINVQMPNNQHNWRGHSEGAGSNLTIKIPRHIRVGFNGVSSNVQIKGFEQGVDIKTVSGEIAASHLQKNIDINTISGDIKSEQLTGKIQFSTVSGDLDDQQSTGRLQMKSVSGHIKTTTNASEVFVETVSGDITLRLAAIDELTIKTVSGDSEVNLTLNEQAMVKLASVSGEFDMKFSDKIQANFNLKTNAGGSISNKITSDKAQRGQYVPSENLTFSTGNGNGSVKASTVSGDIIVGRY